MTKKIWIGVFSGVILGCSLGYFWTKVCEFDECKYQLFFIGAIGAIIGGLLGLEKTSKEKLQVLLLGILFGILFGPIGGIVGTLALSSGGCVDCYFTLLFLGILYGGLSGCVLGLSIGVYIVWTDGESV